MTLFTHPTLLVALSALPVLSVLAVLAARRRQRNLIVMGGLVTGVVLARQRPSRLRGLLLWLGLTCLGMGMAGPRWGRDWSQSAAPGRDLVVVLDASRSMFAEAPSRLERSRNALLDLADTLRYRGGHRVALVVFAGQARLACPLTHDLDHFRDRVLALDLEAPDPTLGAGTRIGTGLVLAVDTHEGRSRQAQDILLISDGDDPARDGEYRRGIDRARAEGIHVHCLAVGDSSEGHRIPDGKGFLTFGGKEVETRLEEAPLSEIARRTGGEYIRAGTTRVPLGEHYLALASPAGDEDSPESLPVYRQRQTWFLLPAFVCLALTLIVPDRRKP
jgi:Ca-activated chloride channel family protein